MKTPIKMQETILIYIGTRMSSDNTRVCCYKNFDTIREEDATIFMFNKRIASIEIVGSKVQTLTNGSTFKNSKVVGRLEKGDAGFEKILQWEMNQKADNQSLQVIRDVKKKNDSGLEATIKELRDCMKYLPRQQKARMARYIFEQLIK